ncbi:MAG TPA: type II secretion system F family protein [Candidatus Ozemobacteraceae bacterium]|nr:type II secretion system F family protein [Candidatus Ozemobacteraceae bacterium]
MAKFDCEVKDSKGKVSKVQLEAESLQKLSALLSDKGYFLVKATEVKAAGFSFGFGGSVSQKDLLVFTVQLSTLVGSAIPLVEAVGILADQTENLYFRSVLESVSKDLQSGKTFSSGLRKFPKVFNNIFCNMCEAGEAGGMLDQVLVRLATFAEADAKMRGKIKGALMMPVVQLVMAVGCVIFLLVKIFPNFTKMFKKMKVELPAITSALILASDTLLEHAMACAGAAVGGGVGIYLFIRTDAGQNLISWLSVTLPICGPITKKIAVSRFARTLCSMLAAGVPILQALKITQSVMGNRAMERVLDDMMISVQGGKGLVASIVNNPLFPRLVVKMMEVGENSGNLDKMLLKVADFYDQEVAEALDGLAGALTPILTVVMGIMIGGIALSVFMPLFSIVQKMK